MVHDDPDTNCPHCHEAVIHGSELEVRCECGDLEFEHGDESCAACSCRVFEWDGTLACPACFERLDDTVPARRVARTEAA